MFLRGHHPVDPKKRAKLRPDVRYEVIDGQECVWIPLANGEWMLADRKSEALLSGHHWHLAYGYAVNGSHQLAHLFILDVPAGLFTDHINGNRLDNRECNLRVVTASQNQFNTGVRVTNRCGLKGIQQRGDKWVARIQANSKSHYLGRFPTKEAAVAARREAELELHGEFRGVDRCQ
jgi:hypothetical protein